MNYRVTLHDDDIDMEAAVSLPFVPFVGLLLVPPWSTEYQSVQEIYWDIEANAFDIYLVDC